MNLEKFTDRAKGFLQAAQTVAIRMSHQRITPEHLLKALLEDGEGMAAQLIQRAGGNAKIATDEVDKALAKVPAVSGSGAQASPGLDNDTVRVLDQAETLATKAGDSFVLFREDFGGRARARTVDPMIKSHLLYQLSYSPPSLGYQSGASIANRFRPVQRPKSVCGDKLRGTLRRLARTATVTAASRLFSAGDDRG